MISLVWLSLLGIPCLILPIRYLILLGVVGVGMGDSKLVPYEFMYYLRFLPMGVLCLRTLTDLHLKRLSVKQPLLMAKIWLPLLGFALFSVMYALEPSLSIQRFLSAVFVLMGFGIGIPLYFPNLKKMVGVLDLIAFVMAVAILYSLFWAPRQELTSSYTQDRERLYGIFNNPNTLGILCMQLFFILIYLYQKRKDEVLGKFIFGVMIAVGIALVASGSRASALGLMVGLIVMTWRGSRIGRRPFPTVVRMVLILMSIFLLAGFFFPTYFGSLFRSDSAGRSVLWERAWRLYEDGPFLGTGFGNGHIVFAADLAYLRSIGIYAPDPHNSFLQLLLELGFIGVGLAAFGFVVSLRRAIKYHRVFEDPELGTILLAVIVGSLVNSLFETWLFSFGNSATVPFWFFLGMLCQQTDRAAIRGKLMFPMVRYREAMLFSSANAKRRKVVSVSTLNGKERLQRVFPPRMQ
jgi:O-antigen ligase